MTKRLFIAPYRLLTLLTAGAIGGLFVSPAQAASFVTNAYSPARDSFSVCNDDSGNWACTTVTLPAWAGYIRGDHDGVLFEPIDANQDGQMGFITHREHAVHCEPDSAAAAGWTCHWFNGGTSDIRSIGVVEIMDYDGDGIDDALYSHSNAGPQVCYGGTFPMVCQDLGIVSATHYTASDWADFNGDGYLDVYLSYYRPWNNGYSQLCFGDGAGGFNCQNFTASVHSSGSVNSDAEAFDANSDGLPDLYIARNPAYGGQGELCLNSTANPGSFTCSTVAFPQMTHQGNPGAYSSTDVEAADLDGDGDEDLVIGSRAAAFACWSDGAGSLSCGYLDGVSTSSEMTTDGAQFQVAVADMNGDGLLDVLKSATNSANSAEVCLNNGDQTFNCSAATAPGIYMGIAPLEVAASSPVDPCADPSTATIVGTPGDDEIYGTPGDDIIFGLGGDDLINGLGGNDILCGGPGDDNVIGGPGDDVLGGGDGYNALRGDDGDDVLYGGDFANELQGGSGNDSLYGGAGYDWILGGGGDDVLSGGGGDDDIDGGDGHDTMFGDEGDDRMTGGQGNDCLDGGAGDDQLLGEAGDDCSNGGDGIDQVACGAGNDGYSTSEWDFSACEAVAVCSCSL